MRIGSTIFVSLRALRRNTMRSILTSLGIIIGVGAVIAVVGIGNGAKTTVEDQIASLGQNVLLIFSGNFNSGGARSGAFGAGTLTIDDAEAIGRETPNVAGFSPEVRTGAQVLANGLNWGTTIFGEGADYLNIRQWPLTAGAMFTEQDVKSVSKVAIIGQTIAKQLFPDDDPLGQTLRIRSQPFRVVGVLEGKGLSVQGSDQDDVVIIPYTSAMKRVTKQTMLRSINVQAVTADAIDRVQADIIGLLRQRHRTTEQTDDFIVRNQEEIAATATRTARTLTILLALVAGVSLFVGGIGIMNIMLVSVTERTREIGIRMAVGAHGSDVLMQFLIEAVILSSMGGILGILLGVVSSQLITQVVGWPVIVSTLSVVIAFFSSAVVGVISGFYPAYKAAQLDPIDALRYE